MLVALPENGRSVYAIRSVGVAIQSAHVPIPIAIVHHRQFVLRRMLWRQ